MNWSTRAATPVAARTDADDVELLTLPIIGTAFSQCPLLGLGAVLTLVRPGARDAGR
jgi:hypothetical protein